MLDYTIAAEIGDIARFASPTKLAGYTCAWSLISSGTLCFTTRYPAA